ncbi:PHP domain-containing protein [Lentzea sp. BCCO 10_0798]|uniref:PHP domain-containing protein n=1 Tax=Lentzea kristufekii TaxID=3095430 RepID=A0ABU4TTX8_9PSEU|nr:PHP domain-containing protein [Lentzea sp. BCCO 10_0798]MDX8051753.1 PHP domain-containing protein [Lentzea sp. BCCO 10_0798]
MTDRRGFLKGTGLAAGAVLAGTPAHAHDERRGGYLWLAGDHHIHSQYSNDAMYPVAAQVQRAAKHGLSWLTITDHGNVPFATHSVPSLVADIAAARRQYEDMLVFTGLEWNIPAGEHTTLMLAPGRHEADLLQEFVTRFDARVNGTRDGTPANEAIAVEALKFLRDAVATGRAADALVLPNHPSRLGINSPQETRNWRDTAPGIVIGMEGAPGHQAAGLPAPGMARGRGLYDSAPSRFSFPGYPAESYRTWGGFDWTAATVGGFWDSLLAEGRPWWITATSDGHQGCGDWVKNPVDRLDQQAYDNVPYDSEGRTFTSTGRFPDPVNSGRPIIEYSSFPPGAYSKTWVGVTRREHREVMRAMRAGRMWVCHGDLVAGLDVRLRPRGSREPGAGMGGTLRVRRGAVVEVVIRIDLADSANFAGFVPGLARVDLITGRITGPAADRSVLDAPHTKVVKSWDVRKRTGVVELVHQITVDGPFYLRVRGTDGKRSAAGHHGVEVDPAGPALDVAGQSDPWEDLWFYSNPVFAAAER